MENETFFIHDPLVKEATEMFKEVSKEVDNNHDPKAIFLKKFMLALHDAAGPKVLSKKIIEFPEEKHLNIKPTIRRLRQLPIQQQTIQPKVPLHIETPEKKPDFLTKPKEKKLPYLKPKFQEKKPTITRSIPKQDHIIFYRFKFKPKKKAFGKLDYLMADKDITAIYCDGPNKRVTVDYKQNKKIPTEIVLKTTNDINKLITLIAKKTKTKVSEKNPILETKINPDIDVHAVFGTEFMGAKFILERT